MRKSELCAALAAVMPKGTRPKALPRRPPTRALWQTQEGCVVLKDKTKTACTSYFYEGQLTRGELIFYASLTRPRITAATRKSDAELCKIVRSTLPTTQWMQAQAQFLMGNSFRRSLMQSYAGKGYQILNPYMRGTPISTIYRENAWISRDSDEYSHDADVEGLFPLVLVKVVEPSDIIAKSTWLRDRLYEQLRARHGRIKLRYKPSLLHKLLPAVSDELAKLFDQAPPLQRDITVYRGSGSLRYKPGTVFETSGPFSTSLNILTGLLFADERSVILRLLVSRGTKCLFMPEVLSQGESEVIFPHGTRLQVVRCDRNVAFTERQLYDRECADRPLILKGICHARVLQ